MKKREFLAMSGALPLMLAGCGSGGSGNASVRLVNASVDYASLGFSVDAVQATTTDVAYGQTSPFESVQAGSVTTALTVSSSGTVTSVSSSTRTIGKDGRFSLVAYGFLNELRSLLITESSTAPDAGNANINVLNTSVDIGAVDVYLSPTPDLSVATLIASSINGVSQSVFAGITAGSYYLTVVGANSIAKGVSDVRFQTPAAVAFVDQQIVTIILTPGKSGTLANAIFLTQGTTGTATSFTNLTARVRAVSAIPAGTAVSVAGVLAAAQPNYSEYFVVATGAAPVVQVGGVTLATAGTLSAGGDYTLMVFNDAGGNATSSLLEDDNTAPVGTSGVKFRLINLATADELSMSVNSILAASNIGFAAASAYKELSEPQTTASVVQVLNGASTIKTLLPQVLQAGRIFTEIVIDVSVSPVQDFFLASSES